MIAVANFQYAWTLFVPALKAKDQHWSLDQIRTAFFVFFVLSQTWLVPFEAYLADRFGPRLVVVAGGVLSALGWVLSARAESLSVLYLAQAISGCGSGIVYGVSMGSALKWFPDRRGLAAGLIAAAFGTGSAATVLPISTTIKTHGYQNAFEWFGLGQGLVIVLAGTVMRFPRREDALPAAPPKLLQSSRDYTPKEMLQTPSFWLLYVMMTVGAVPGLFMIGEMRTIAEAFELADTKLLLTFTALEVAIFVDRISGGLTRPVFGWVSDHIGRELAIFLAFSLEGVSLLLFVLLGRDPVWFVLTSGVAFFGWGAIFSLFPAVSGDMFGRRFATTNYGILYTAKGAAALLGSLCGLLQTRTQSWTIVFAVMIALDVLAACLALFVLPRVRRWQIADLSQSGMDQVAPEVEPIQRGATQAEEGRSGSNANSKPRLSDDLARTDGLSGRLPGDQHLGPTA